MLIGNTTKNIGKTLHRIHYVNGKSCFSSSGINKLRIKTEMNIYMHAAAAAAKLLQLCLTLCDPRDSSPPGSTVPGILQARTLEWVSISFSNIYAWVSEIILKKNQQHQSAGKYGECRGPAWGIPPVAKVMRKEAWHTQRRDQASGNLLFPSI